MGSHQDTKAQRDYSINAVGVWSVRENNDQGLSNKVDLSNRTQICFDSAFLTSS